MKTQIDNLIKEYENKSSKKVLYLINRDLLMRMKYLLNEIENLIDIREKLEVINIKNNTKNKKLHSAERIAYEVKFNFFKGNISNEFFSLTEFLKNTTLTLIEPPVIEINLELIKFSKDYLNDDINFNIFENLFIKS